MSVVVGCKRDVPHVSWAHMCLCARCTGGKRMRQEEEGGNKVDGGSWVALSQHPLMPTITMKHVVNHACRLALWLMLRRMVCMHKGVATCVNG